MKPESDVTAKVGAVITPPILGTPCGNVTETTGRGRGVLPPRSENHETEKTGGKGAATRGHGSDASCNED